MPKLDVRLTAVAQQILSKTHVDIGSDHGSLLVSMLNSGRIEFGIAIENKRQPFENSARALTGLPAEVRFGDGLQVLQQDEADSLSICGMGAKSMRKILAAHPNRIPPNIVLQTNHEPEIIRGWALDNGYHLVDEQIARGLWPYVTLSFRRAEDSKADDPAYQDVSRQAALLFGPLVLKRKDRPFEAQLREEEFYWGNFEHLEPRRARRLELIREILAGRSY